MKQDIDWKDMTKKMKNKVRLCDITKGNMPLWWNW